MCTPYITYEHRCLHAAQSPWLVMFDAKRQRCPFCKRTCGQLVDALEARVVRAPSAGAGGLTGRPYAPGRAG